MFELFEFLLGLKFLINGLTGGTDLGWADSVFVVPHFYDDEPAVVVAGTINGRRVEAHLDFFVPMDS